MKPLLFATLLLLAPAAARAQELTAPSTPHVADPEAEPPPPPEQAAPVSCDVCFAGLPPGRTHDGFYLRLQIGVGYMSAERDGFKFSGDAFSLGAAVGVIVVPNLAVFGTFLWNEARNPSANEYGSQMTLNGSLTTESFGGGLAYYLEPVNLYAAAAALANSALIVDAGNAKVGSANRGLGFEIMVGKEWWVGREWGLGVAGEATWGSSTDTDNHYQSWRLHTYSLLFSATYN